jgi:hypothetical protein
MKVVQASLIAVVAMVGISANAATQNNYCKTDAIKESNCKNIPSNRREELGRLVAGGNPVAVTNDDGNLKVHYTVSGSKLQSCQITNNVKSFKMSGNSGDRSTIYFVTEDGRLFDAKMTGSVGPGQCPKADTQKYASDVVEYKVASDSHSVVTMAARTKNGAVIYSTDKAIFNYGYFSESQANAALDYLINQF